MVLGCVSIQVQSEEWHLGDLLQLGGLGVASAVGCEEFHGAFSFFVLDEELADFSQSHLTRESVIVAELSQLQVVVT